MARKIPQRHQNQPRPRVNIKIKREDMLGHRKLQIETRLKLLAKWNPKKWGDKQTIDMTVNESLAERLARAKQRNGNES